MKKILIPIIILILLAVGAGVWWLFDSGRLVYSSSPSNNEIVARQAIVCDEDTVDLYNDAMYFRPRNGEATSSIDSEEVKRIVADIKTKDGYDSDPTCQTILFWVAIYDKDLEAAISANSALQELYIKGMYSSPNIRSNQPLFSYDGFIEGIRERDENESFGG